MKFNLPSNQEKFARIGQIMSRAKEIKNVEAMAYKSPEMTKQLSLDVGIPGSLKEVGVDLAMMDKLVADTMKSGNVKANPRRSTEKEIAQIITNAYNGVL
jgi:alcohol dehydrogenase class IV